MKENKLKKIAVFLVAIIAIVVLVGFVIKFVVQNDNKNANAEKSKEFAAYIDGFGGSNNSLEELKIDTDVVGMRDDFINTLSSSQIEYAKSAFEESKFKIIDVKENNDGKSIEINYTVDEFPIFDLLLETQNKMSSFLTQDEIQIFEDANATPEQRELIINKFEDEYKKNLEEMKPENKRHTLVMEANDEGVYILSDEQIKEIFYQVVGALQD